MRIVSFVCVSRADGVVMFGVLCAYMKAAFIGPVLVYCLALSCVVWKAAARSSTRFPLAGVQLGCVGALAFLASDSTLAFTKFVGDFQGSEFVVMVTYYVAQVGVCALYCCHVVRDHVWILTQPPPQEACVRVCRYA